MKGHEKGICKLIREKIFSSCYQISTGQANKSPVSFAQVKKFQIIKRHTTHNAQSFMLVSHEESLISFGETDKNKMFFKKLVTDHFSLSVRERYPRRVFNIYILCNV